MQIDTTCTKCGKTFRRNTNVNGITAAAVGRDSEAICYSCSLESLVGKRRVPEEGDFNSARLISGEISDQELDWLMEDLWAVERGGSIREPYEEDREYIDICPKCGADRFYCSCDLDEDDFVEEDPRGYHCYECGAPVESAEQRLCDECDVVEQGKFEHEEGPVEKNLSRECKCCGAFYETDERLCPSCDEYAWRTAQALTTEVLRLQIWSHEWWHEIGWLLRYHWRNLTHR